MSLIIALPKKLFLLLCTLLFNRKPLEHRATYRRLPPKPDSRTVYYWTHYLIRRFPSLDWEWTCKGEWVYIKFTAPAPGYLTGLQSWLGGGILTESALVYAVALSEMRC